MPRRASGETRSQKNQTKNQRLTLLDLKETFFRTKDGKQVNVEDATDAEFDAFIRQHVQIGWSLEERRDALNLAFEQGKSLGMDEQSPPEAS